MFKPTKSLEPPDKFPFPVEPYSIQSEFMKNLYEAIESRKLGIFESPTGTGKSLSLICGSFRWLIDNEERFKDQLEKEISKFTEDEPANEKELDWFASQSKNHLKNRQKQELVALLKKLQLKEERINEMKKRCKTINTDAVSKADLEFRKLFGGKKLPEEDLDSELKDELQEVDPVLEEYDSEEEGEDRDEEDDPIKPEDVKIIYSSRTHSQLSQFVNEVKSSPYANSIRLVSLASRQSLCINPSVNRLKSQALINERCLELKKGRKGKATKTIEDSDSGHVVKRSRNSKGCPFLCSAPMKRLTEEMLVSDGGISDIEDLVTRGKRIKACPYYAAREAVKDAQVIVVPYNSLLHHSTREACGITLEGNIVIIDEAHNLLDTIEHIHSAEITGNQLTHSYSQLKQYHSCYRSRLNAKNLLHLNQLIFVIGKLIRMVGGVPGCNPMDYCKEGPSATKLFSIPEFISNAEIDCMNLYVLRSFIKKSKLTRKLQGFSELYATRNDELKSSKPCAAPKASGVKAFLSEISRNKKEGEENKVVQAAKENLPADEGCGNSPLLPVISFLEGLANKSSDGRVAVTRSTSVGQGSLKFLLLNPAAHFSDIVCFPRSLILAGGTMQPISELEQQLSLSILEHNERNSLKVYSKGIIPSEDPRDAEKKSNGFKEQKTLMDRMLVFSCGHVVPAENILPVVLMNGPSGKALNFSFGLRTNPEIIHELGRTLLNLCNIIPGGVIVFFPSYDYESYVYNQFEKNGVLTKLEARKKIFREPKKSSDMDKILDGYASCIKNTIINTSKITGAILLSVVGGKMSEGINFSNELGRCVIMVGMPYANIQSAELREKMAFLDTHSSTPSAGQRYYESLCMKAVNQSIGRCIRHKGDYAAMILLDNRYGRPKTIAALPSWIQTSITVQSSFGAAVASIRKFFTSKNTS